MSKRQPRLGLTELRTSHIQSTNSLVRRSYGLVCFLKTVCWLAITAFLGWALWVLYSHVPVAHLAVAIAFGLMSMIMALTVRNPVTRAVTLVLMSSLVLVWWLSTRTAVLGASGA